MPESVVVALVLCAALLHATWNAIVKHSGERTLTFAVAIATGGLVCLPVLFFLKPPDPASFRFMLGSAVIHHFYYAGLLLGYRWGDLGQVYPIARGAGPLIVALLGGPLAGEYFGLLGWIGMALVSAGIFAIVGRVDESNRRAVAIALFTGVTIAGYTLCDGLGVRHAGTKLAYIAWLNVLTGLPFPIAVAIVRRRELGPFFVKHGRRAMFGGLIGVVAYGLVIWAMSGSQLAYVAALRETSVVIAAAIGAFALGEKFGMRRIFAAGVVASGIVLLAVARR